MSAPSTTLAPASPTDAQRSGMRAVLWTQALGIVAEGTYANGTLLLYLTALGLGAGQTMAYLEIPSVTMGICLLPAAFCADRFGFKRVGQIGLAIGLIGWSLVSLAGGLTSAAEAVVVSGIACTSLGIALMMAGWLPLLRPIIPEAIRGRFFGKLRITFSLVLVVLSAAYAAVLSIDSSLPVYQGIFALAALAYAGRWLCYRRIPGPEIFAARANETATQAETVTGPDAAARSETPHHGSILESLRQLIRMKALRG